MSVEGVSKRNSTIAKGIAIGAGVGAVVGGGRSVRDYNIAKKCKNLSKDMYVSCASVYEANLLEKVMKKTLNEEDLAKIAKANGKMYDYFINFGKHPVKSVLKTVGIVAAVGVAAGAVVGGVVALVKKVKQNKAEKQQ
mgnify:CR=1 FL=1